jgi:hypothetical protein
MSPLKRAKGGEREDATSNSVTIICMLVDYHIEIAAHHDSILIEPF